MDGVATHSKGLPNHAIYLKLMADGPCHGLSAPGHFFPHSSPLRHKTAFGVANLTLKCSAASRRPDAAVAAGTPDHLLVSVLLDTVLTIR